MKRDNRLRIVVILAVLALSVWSLIPSIRVFMKPAEPTLPLEMREREIFKRENPNIANKSINLGLDLAGGTHIIVEVQKDQVSEDERFDVVDRSLEILRNRVDQYGLSEPIITRSGENRIIASLAGMGAEEARSLIGATAQLEFKLLVEPSEFRSVLNRVDAHLTRNPGLISGLKIDPGSPVRTEVESVFGRVVEEDESRPTTIGDADSLSGADSLTATDTSALAKSAQDVTDSLEGAFADEDETAEEFYQNRPFGSLLMGVGRDIGVRADNVSKVERILKEPSVKQAVPHRYQFVWGRELETLDDGTKYKRLYLLKARPEMTGSYIANAEFNRITSGLNAGEMEVGLSFKGLGPKEFARITGANVGRQLAIVLDSVVYSAPVIQGRISQGRASITGINDFNEAKRLAVTLRAGSLPAPMEIVELRSVGPTLGEENIQKGMNAGLIAMLMVAAFMLIYYRGAGLVANIALFFNIVIIGAVLSAFHATLTLPGIAGIVLTIGMAVDANVIIYERIREELATGRSVRAAIDAGYQKAFSAIFDSNITTLGTAAVLYYIGVGPIKGFGLTLMIGLAASMFTSIYVTRVIFDIAVEKTGAKSLSLGNGLPFLNKVNLSVIPKAKIWAGISGAVLLGCFVAVIARGGLNYGIDFTGGNLYQVAFEQTPDVESIRSQIEAKGLASPKVQTLGGGDANELLISLPKADDDAQARRIVQEVVGNAQIVNEETVGPTIGADLKMAAIWATIISLIIIVLYVWFRFGRVGLGFGIAAVIALAHDALFTVGFFSLMGREISLTFVAAVLTIIGFSLNDTIVIFDRIRENTGTLGKDSYAKRVNDSVNQTFNRTIITSLTTFMAVAVLYFFGGSSIRDFNIAMMAGIISGVYSTLAVASPFVVWWHRRNVASAASAPSKAAIAAAKKS